MPLRRFTLLVRYLEAVALRIRPSAPIEYRPWHPRVWALLAIGAIGLGLLLGLALSTFWPRGRFAQDEYHLWRWEAETLVNSMFRFIGIGPAPGDEHGDQSLAAYFRLTSALRAAQGSPEPDVRLLETLTNERATYENDVERVVERRISEAVDGAGLQRGLPLFRGVSVTWPPVDFELTSPPQLLVRSPRKEIRRAGDTLLRNDLTLREVESIERRADDSDTVSLVVSVGGIAAYPAIVRDDRSYDSLLDTAAHEWVHHYLAFYPLGEQWGKGGDAETLNETTADLAGVEIANLVRAAHPVRFDEGADGTNPARAAPNVDFTKEMRALRQEVDALLAEEKVAEAERLMEDRRKFLADNGIVIRKINQAYFAFYGTYAESPASSNPIGPRVRRVFELTGDVGTFLRAMRNVRSAKDLDGLLSALEQPGR